MQGQTALADSGGTNDSDETLQFSKLDYLLNFRNIINGETESLLDSSGNSPYFRGLSGYAREINGFQAGSADQSAVNLGFSH